MQIHPRKLFALVILLLALGALAGLLYTDFGTSSPGDNGATGPDFPRITIDEAGAVSKDLPALSITSIIHVPSRQLKRLIFGINPVVLEIPASATKNTERVVFTIDNKPSDIFQEYKEYFTAIGWIYSVTTDPIGLVVSASDIRTTITIAPRSAGGSLIAIVQSTNH